MGNNIAGNIILVYPGPVYNAVLAAVIAVYIVPGNCCLSAADQVVHCIVVDLPIVDPSDLQVRNITARIFNHLFRIRFIRPDPLQFKDG